jgi:hypothetical protein
MNFDLKKYLAEGKLQNEQSDFADVYMNDNIKSAFDALVDAIKDEQTNPTI